MLHLILLCGAAALAGCVDALVGGGGLIQLPALFASYPAELPARLLGTNKCVSMLGTASAVARYARAVTIPWRLLSFGIPVALVASFAGAVLATRVRPDVFRPLVPILLLAVLISTLRHRNFGGVHAPHTLERTHYFAAAGLIAAIGLYDGFFGPGTGGFFMVLFVRLLGFDLVNAAASARVLNLATNVAAMAWFSTQGDVIWPVAAGMAAFNVAGAQVGSHLAVSGGARLMRPVFISVVLVLIMKTAYDALLLMRA